MQRRHDTNAAFDGRTRPVRAGCSAFQGALRQPSSSGRRSWLLGATACLMAASLGCGGVGGLGGSGDPADSSAGRFVRLLERYRIAHRGQLPASEAAVREFASTIGADDLAVLGVSSSEECFAPGRDGQPLVIRLGGPVAGGDPSVVCYEQEGVGGLRIVGKLGGQVELADAARFAELVPEP